ncbi:uncharacterized protein LOC142234582 [Haematobia irritans]|uniref:uncharacterized protein LOC142229742 n=1 Tax=Haematobia irritans TaxID=7368 RepID=UPI003F5057C3
MEVERNMLYYIKDWTIIKQKWSLTSTYRKKTLKGCIKTTIDLWPIYKDERIADLVDIDYNVSFPNYSFNYENWTKLLNNHEKIFPLWIKDPILLNMLRSLMAAESIEIDEKTAKIFTMLHGILKPSMYWKNGVRKKTTIVNSQHSFTKQIQDISQYESNEEEITILVTDHISYKGCFVAFGKVVLKFHSYLDAIIFSFKLHKTINHAFALECKNLWLFVETYLFDFPLEKSVPNVVTFVNDLKNCT